MAVKEECMAAHLRVYTEPTDSELVSPPADVCVSLRELLPLMALAQGRNFLWLRDFLDDEVRITQDLHEVLLAFQSRRPAG